MNKAFDEQIFNDQITNISQFYFDRYIKICLKGNQLSKKMQELSESVGVKHPEKIRILKVDQGEYNKLFNPQILDEIRSITNQYGQLDMGLTYKYGIILNKSIGNNKKILMELFRFITYYECFGSIKAFLNIYLRNVRIFGWENNPFNRDAIYTSNKYYK